MNHGATESKANIFLADVGSHRKRRRQLSRRRRCAGKRDERGNCPRHPCISDHQRGCTARRRLARWGSISHCSRWRPASARCVTNSRYHCRRDEPTAAQLVLLSVTLNLSAAVVAAAIPRALWASGGPDASASGSTVPLVYPSRTCSQRTISDRDLLGAPPTGVSGDRCHPPCSKWGH